jgi:transcriptional activator SPT7
MNNNIKTMKRVRHTHAKFAALNLNLGAGAEEEGEGGGGGMGIGSGFGAGQGVTVAMAQDEDGIEAVYDKIDERPWSARIKGKGRHTTGGIEIGEEIAADCVHWMGGKVLEHAGFQGMLMNLLFVEVLIFVYSLLHFTGSSQAALDVLTGVTAEYLLNVGRTIRFLCDKYSATMTPEVIFSPFSQTISHSLTM